jgi:putative DNA primase/helicase
MIIFIGGPGKGTGENIDEKWHVFLERFREPKDGAKDSAGWYVAGEFKGHQRKAEGMVSRTMVTIDIDHGGADTYEAVADALRRKGLAGVLHSTYSHEPLLGEYKYRLIVPLSAPVRKEEYKAAAEELMALLGIEGADPASLKANQFMYFPATGHKDGYEVSILGGNGFTPAVPALPKGEAARLGDPRDKPGAVGGFCRAYTVPEAIEAFLSDVYEPFAEGRYTYTPGTARGGLAVYDGLWVYSNHATDPAATGHCLNAYDLVYTHKGGDVIATALAQRDFADVALEADDTPKAEGRPDKDYVAFTKKGGAQVNPAKLAEAVRRESHLFITREVAMYYDRGTGVWRMGAEEFIRGSCLKKLGPIATTGVISDATRLAIDGEIAAAGARERLPEGPLSKITLKGGVYDLVHDEYTPGYSPENYATAAHPIVYDRKAEAPLWDGFIAATLGADTIPFMEEWTGVCFYRLYTPQAILFLVGGGGSGKSTHIEIMAHVVGEDASTAVSLRQLKESPFAASRLYGKTANFDSDAKREYLADADFLKSLTGDILLADVKYKPPIRFRNAAKLTFAMNSMPSVHDTSGGFERRAIILRTLLDKVPKDVMLRYPAGLIKEERSGIFNKAMHGLRRVLKTGGFSITPRMQQQLEEYMLEQDTVAQFFEAEDPFAKAGYIKAKDLYDLYTEFCYENGERKGVVGATLFGRRAREMGYRKEAKKIEGKTYKVYCKNAREEKTP